MKSVWTSVKFLRWGSTHKYSVWMIMKLIGHGLRFDPSNRINTYNERVR